eukprot:Gb_40540 [translate_table: standard]
MDKEVAELRTSSARKRRFVCISSSLVTPSNEFVGGKNAKGASHTKELTDDSCRDLRLAFSTIDEPSIDRKVCMQATHPSIGETIFSPVLHMPKGVPIEASTRCNRGVEHSEHPDGKIDIADNRQDCNSSVCEENIEEGLLNSDGASLFLAMQQTKSLDCSDKTDTESGVPDELDDFDPHLFIKTLPDLAEVVSPYRPMLLPRQARRWPPITLVLDLDETLVHSTLEHCDDADFTFPVHFNLKEHTVYVRRRPYLQVFMERVAQMFEIIVFTASQSIYAEQLLNMLDPKQRLIRHRVYRESCVFVEGNYMKDLTVLGRDLAKIAIIDNSPQAFGFQVDNGIPIESWFDDRSDCALVSLLPFLETLVGVDDVRPIIAKKFNLRQKIASFAMEYPSLEHREDLFDCHL